MSHRKQRDGRFKAQVALEAIKNQQTISEIASEYGVNPAQVSQWKKQVLEELPQLFTKGRPKTASDNDELVSELYRQIGQSYSLRPLGGNRRNCKRNSPV